MAKAPHTIILFFFLFSCSSLSIFGQSAEDFSFFEQNIAIKERVKQKKKSTKDVNELELSLRLLFTGYSKYISSQDGSVCSFHPSCSGYARTSLARNGLLKGSIQTMDRLVRCNGFSPEKYEIDFEKGKLIDHVQ